MMKWIAREEKQDCYFNIFFILRGEAGVCKKEELSLWHDIIDSHANSCFLCLFVYVHEKKSKSKLKHVNIFTDSDEFN